MQFSLEKRKRKSAIPGVAYAPQYGEVRPIDEIADPVFAEKILGDGVCLLPEKDQVLSPVNGVVTNIIDTEHALGIIADDGAEIIIHVGVDTVEMKGAGFEMKVKEGQRVSVGEVLLKADLSKIKMAGYPTHTAMVISNGEQYKVMKVFSGKALAGKSPAFSYIKLR
jgi:glucose-specific phosphotransferase system IIA component